MKTQTMVGIGCIIVAGIGATLFTSRSSGRYQLVSSPYLGVLKMDTATGKAWQMRGMEWELMTEAKPVAAVKTESIFDQIDKAAATRFDPDRFLAETAPKR